MSSYRLPAPPPMVVIPATCEVSGLQPCASAREVPADAAVIAVDCRAGVAEELYTELRRSLPAACFVAWLTPERAFDLEHALRLGFDEVALGEHHLTKVLTRVRCGIETASCFDHLMAMHKGLLQVVSEIACSPELQDVLRVSILRISELFGIDRVSVVIFDHDAEVGFVIMERERALLDNIVISVSDYPELQQVITTKEPLVIPDVFGDALLAGVRGKLTSAQQPHRAAALFPLIRRNSVVGALFLRSDERMDEMSEQQLVTGRLISSITAVAIGQALEHDMLLSEKLDLQESKAWADEQLAGLKELREFLDQAKDGVLITDAQGVIRYTNGAAATLLRLDPASLPQRHFKDLLMTHSHALADRALRGDAVGDENGYVDLIAGTGEGGATDSVVISAAIRPLTHPQGAVISFRDVTVLREIENELRQTKEFLENLIQSSVDAIIATDTDGRVLLFNRAAEQMLGYSVRDVVGEVNINIFYQEGEAQDVMQKLRSDAYGGRGRLRMVRKDLVARNGDIVPVNLTAATIYEETREVATVSILSDLRERRRIEEKLSQVQKKLQLTERQAVAVELAGVAAHELNQPLTSILAYAELLKRRAGADHPDQRAIEVICSEAERMASIVRKIGQITSYQTKPYVGSSQILDLGDPQDEDKSG